MHPVIRMHACNFDCSAAHSAQWQELELIFGWLLQHGNMRERSKRVAHASLRPAETFMRAVVHLRKQHLSVYKNVQTIISWLLPALKGFYNMHAQLTSVSYIHAKRRVRYVYIRKHWLAYFSYTEMVTCMRVLHEDEICFTSMEAIFNRS